MSELADRHISIGTRLEVSFGVLLELYLSGELAGLDLEAPRPHDQARALDDILVTIEVELCRHDQAASVDATTPAGWVRGPIEIRVNGDLCGREALERILEAAGPEQARRVRAWLAACSGSPSEVVRAWLESGAPPATG